MGIVYLDPLGVYICIYQSTFRRTPLTISGNAPMGDLLYRVINPYILMLYTAYSPPQTKNCSCDGPGSRFGDTPEFSQHPVAYLGFQKGAKFSLATSAHTKGETNFSNFFPMSKKLFLAKGGHGPIPPLNTPLPTHPGSK